MTKGFYNLTSGVLSQGRRLDAVANNMTNLSTPGYKSELYTDQTFEEVLISRVGNKDKSNPEEIGEQSYMLAPDELYINYDRGTFEETGLNLDFAIQQDGFFAIQTEGGTEYTRGGSFALDDEGYLYLPGHGRVLGADNQPIYLPNDNIRADGNGRLYDDASGAYLGQLGVFTFADNEQLEKSETGLFTAGGQAAQNVQNADVMWKYVENSNVDMMQEMSRMLTTQRALQSAAQILKLYDNLLNKTVTEVGRM